MGRVRLDGRGAFRRFKNVLLDHPASERRSPRAAGLGCGAGRHGKAMIVAAMVGAWVAQVSAYEPA